MPSFSLFDFCSAAINPHITRPMRAMKLHHVKMRFIFMTAIIIYYRKVAKEIRETEDFVNSSIQKMKNGEELQVVILNKITGEFLGHGGISKLKSETPELGIWIKKRAHGNKYGREAAKGLKKWMLGQFLISICP